MDDFHNSALGRRRFACGLGASLAAPALILPGTADATEEKRGTEVIRSLIAVSILRRRIALNWLMVKTANQILGVDLRGKFRQDDENRADFSSVLGNFQRPTIGRQIDNAMLAGGLFLNGKVLFLLSQSAEVDKVLLGMRLRVAHGSMSWLAGAFQPVSVTGYPVDEIIEGYRRVGELYITAQNIALAMVYPVLGRNSAAGF